MKKLLKSSVILCVQLRYLKSNNIKLDLSEATLDLDFVGDFKFSHTTMERKKDLINHPDEFALGYFFYSGNDSLLIVQDDSSYVVIYIQYLDGGCNNAYHEIYGSDGEISIMI